MMNIDEKIREIAVNTFPDWSFVFDDWFGADKTIGKVKLPVVMELLPVAGAITLRNGQTRNSQTCVIAFLDRVRRDAQGGDESEVYNRMVLAAETFIRALNASGFFEQVTNVTYYVVPEQTATIVTGVYLDLTLTEVVGRC